MSYEKSEQIDTSKYLHGWWERQINQSHNGRMIAPKVECYYFFDIKSRNVTSAVTKEEKVLYGFLAMKIVWNGSRERISFTNPGEQYQKYYSSFFESLKKTAKRRHIKECIKDLLTKDFDKWIKKYSGWKNIVS